MQESSTSYTLKCNISQEVNHLHEGIALGLRDDREKVRCVAVQPHQHSIIRLLCLGAGTAFVHGSRACIITLHWARA